MSTTAVGLRLAEDRNDDIVDMRVWDGWVPSRIDGTAANADLAAGIVPEKLVPAAPRASI